MGNGSRSGAVASEKGGGAIDCGVVGLGLKMQRTETFPCKRQMVAPYYHPPTSSSSGSGGGYGDAGSGSGGGPILGNGYDNQFLCVSESYDVVGTGTVAKTLHHFKSSDPVFKPSAGFTSCQLQELERQAMVYKYMMASIPVPPQLLIPIGSPLADASSSHPMGKGSVELRFSNSSDPEPWRCRRTDGKKWRCSRDVAPDQKYCERHTHKGRPRSRKPVELHAASTTAATAHRHPVPLSSPSAPAVVSASSTNRTIQQKHPPFLEQTHGDVSLFPNMVSPTQYDLHRCSEWFTKGETVAVAKTYSSNNADMDDGQVLQFIDAWSAAERDNTDDITNRCSTSSNRKPSFPSLTLSMSSENGANQGNDEENEEGLKSQPLNWMGSASWMGSPPGGPLAEALCLGIATGGKVVASDGASPHGCSTATATTPTSTSSCGDSRQGFNLINEDGF